MGGASILIGVLRTCPHLRGEDAPVRTRPPARDGRVSTDQPAYRIDEKAGVVHILDIDHRAEIHRPR
jgi:hypothetical protein